jgi:hypothetical protein
MPNRRKGAPGSFGAPLDELLPRIGTAGPARLFVDIHRKPEQSESQRRHDSRCRIFLLNQSLYERATRN